MLDVMIDLETMGTTPGSAIVAIGAVEFDTQACVLGERFYSAIDLTSCVESGLAVDAETVLWWLQRSDTARRALTSATRTLREVLVDFSAWLGQRAPTDNVRVWGNGPSFDCALLSAAYRACAIETPWRFWNERCLRTVKGMFPSVEPLPRDGTHHHALDDALYQAEHILHIRRTLQARKT